MPDLPMSEFSIDTLTQKLIVALKAVASKQNQSSIIIFGNSVAATKAQNQWLFSQGLPQIPLPQPPMLNIVNEALVAANEQGVGEKDWTGVFFQVPYVPIEPPPPVKVPVTIGGEDVAYPGFYDTLGGDGPTVPVGSVVVQDGKTYRKTVIGHSPFAPGGNVTLFQRIA